MLDILKQGEVTDVDIANGKARVMFPDRDNKISDWLNILVPFSESHSDNYHLEKGQTVIVLSLPDMMEQGYILGCPMRPSTISEGEVKRTFSDGGFYSYRDGVLTLSPITKVVITADVELKKTLTVDGDTTFKTNTNTKGTAMLGGINLNDHTHGGVKAGGDMTGGPS